jgi:hypothetical protein
MYTVKTEVLAKQTDFKDIKGHKAYEKKSWALE